ncbi:transcription factor MYB4 [Ziziphus jujuba]|uniref:Transcription factor MYB4 n=2 Tax=Ziziphus jujuba TaxID=326968 RepID=A0ABM3IR80_ZIZJJ|nr:transcription factor MYB4 [Ziziphus jujuba]KAH7522091.1 hypothetical protein FEM48_Zijuj07G0101000 [Ziziphus jujuba var. spinosa]
MVRAPCCEKMGLKKGPWTPEEDQILISYIEKYGHGNWRALPKQAGLLRCGKSCRLRWINYLRPDIKRGNFTKEEEEAIINLHEMLGNRWSAIAARLPGRTDNEIKNVWHTHLKKRLTKNSHGSSESKAPFSAISKLISQKSLSEPESMSSSSQQEPSSSEFSSVTDTNSVTTTMETTIEDKAIMNNIMIKNETMEFSEDFPEIDESFWSEALSDGNSGNPFEFSDGLQHQSSFSSSESVELNRGFIIPNVDDSMEFWYDLFISAGGAPELPEF